MADGLGTNSLCLVLQEKLRSGALSYQPAYVSPDPTDRPVDFHLQPASECDASVYSYFKLTSRGIIFNNGFEILFYYTSSGGLGSSNAQLLSYFPDVRLTANADEFVLFINNVAQPDTVRSWNNCALDSRFNFTSYYSEKYFNGLFGNIDSGDGGDIAENTNESNLPGVWTITAQQDSNGRIRVPGLYFVETHVDGGNHNLYIIAGTSNVSLDEIKQFFVANRIIYYSDFTAQFVALATTQSSISVNSYLCVLIGTISQIGGSATSLIPVGISIDDPSSDAADPNRVYCKPSPGDTAEDIAADYARLKLLRSGDRVFFDSPVKFVTLTGTINGTLEDYISGNAWWSCTRSTSEAISGSATLNSYGDAETRGGPGEGGTGVGGGFDKNWLIKRNVKPIDVKIYSPSEFNTRPESAGEFCCKPNEAYVAARSRNEIVASVNATSGGDVGITANRHIKAKAGQSINAQAGTTVSIKASSTVTIKGSAIFLN